MHSLQSVDVRYTLQTATSDFIEKLVRRSSFRHDLPFTGLDESDVFHLFLKKTLIGNRRVLQ
jgi:hypothetical protein